MSLEQKIDELTAAIVSLTKTTEELKHMRVEGLAKVEAAAAAPVGKTNSTKTTKPAEAPVETQANITASPEDRKDPANPEPAATTPTTPTGPSKDDVKAKISAYVMSGSPDPEKDAAEINARKAEIFGMYDKIGAKLTPPRAAGQTKLDDVPAEKYSALLAGVEKRVAELAAAGGRLVKPAAAATSDDDL